MKATLILENGSAFDGTAIGAEGERMGEVILNTSVVGYQEIMTDPSNAGKIVVLTYPMIGNYGVADKFYESPRCWMAGLVIKESSRIYSNWQAEGSFDEFLKKEGLVTISGVDTRALAVTIRDKGEMVGMISPGNPRPLNESLKVIENYKRGRKMNFISQISVNKPTVVKKSSPGPHIAVLDLGMLKNFITQLKALGSSITLLPYSTTATDILTMKFDGLVVSNGPEEDEAIPRITETVKKILGRMPIMGISTGHEVIGLALGGRLKKMPIGHHGVNYPVSGQGSYKGEITVQNHSYAVDEASIKEKKAVTITLRNINDKSIEGMESKALKFLSTQYYPSSPGFDEVNEAFRRFCKMIPQKRPAGREVQHAKT